MAASLHDRPGVVHRLLEAGARPLDVNWSRGSALDMTQSAAACDLIVRVHSLALRGSTKAARELAARRWRVHPDELLQRWSRGDEVEPWLRDARTSAIRTAPHRGQGASVGTRRGPLPSGTLEALLRDARSCSVG